ncbi:competence type IV pilus minor pilin ComGD [Piscibacillus halophilus]|uniref:Competence protein ComGD n=2 Tax=Piscibacillus halophilus TaxID=571933 RepID=A0A1H9AC66_9BACI|nr:competence type IV pilus minor pilin ComGD [Piscibacillus halophilus]SEP74336.1 competence protein ComGD [Piscibacillus halophilus]
MVKLISMNHKQRGFTLLETLLVLSIIMVLVAISMTNYSLHQNTKPVDEFLTQFEKDVFIVQQRAITFQTPISITFNTNEHYYYIHDLTTNPSTIRRHYHPDLSIVLTTLKNPIRYNIDGTIYNPGAFMLNYNNSKYQVTFPFGKGRFYVNKM